MQTKTFRVPNISCGHCKMRVEKALNGLDGITSAAVDVASKMVTAEWDEATVTWETIRAALEKVGYPPE